MAERQLLVRIVGDDRDLQRAFSRSEKRAKTFGASFTAATAGVSRAFAAAGVTIGAATLTSAISASVSAASDLNEQVAKSQAVFGASSRDVEAWAKTTAESFGISEVAALSAAGAFGNMLLATGLAGQEAAVMSQRMVELAADMASFSNADPSEMLIRIQSGLAGEAEPLRRYGVLLSEARVQQQAMADTGKTNVRELTNQEKVLARYKIILQDTIPQQGNFADTSEGLANQTRILKARLNDLSADIGTLLIPALLDAAAGAQLLFDAMEKLRDLDLPGFDLPEVPEIARTGAALAIPGGGLIGLGRLRRQLEGEDEEFETLGRTVRSERGAEAMDNLIARDKAIADKAREAERASRRSRRDFDAFVKGIGLGLDQASLTASFADDLRLLDALERAILRRIEKEGRTFELVQMLIDVRTQKTAVLADRAERAAQASRDAYDAIIASLELSIDKAAVTASFNDDIRAAEALQNAIRKRIASEGETTELLRQLFEAEQLEAQARRDQAEQIREQRQGRQFQALGLTAAGEKITPSVGALGRRLPSIEDMIKGTVLDTPKTRAQLEVIGKILSGAFGKVGEDVRQAILGMFNDWTDTLKEDSEEPITEFRKTSTKVLTEGLGLTPEQRKILRERMAAAGQGGAIPQRSPFGVQPTTAPAGDTFTINGDIIVEGGDSDAVLRAIQNKTRKRAATRTGRRRGSRTGIS